MAIMRSLLETIARRPALVIAPMAVAGTVAGLAPGVKSATGTFMETVTGDRNAIGKIAKAQLRSSFENLVNTPDENNVMEYLTRNYSRTPNASLYGPGGGPSGSVVFGMYNLRAK